MGHRSLRSATPRRLVVATGVLGFVVLTFFVGPVALRAAGRWLDVGVAPRPADHVYPLGGDPAGRPFAAAAVIRAGLAREALIPRLAGDRDGFDPAGAPLVRRVLEVRGVAPARIRTLDPICHTTYDEARSLAAVLEAEPAATLIVVTNDYHSRRVRWILDRELGPAAARVQVVTCPTDHVPADWFRTADGLSLYGSEFLKLAFYHLRYGSGLYHLAALVLVALAVRFAFRRRRRAPS
jgi:uncharacterized SAM-binding protein YcdF (DUF218 family)